MEIYIVKPGDSIYKIAKEFDVDLEYLLSINGLTPTDVLSVGQAILILFPKEIVVVKKGDTLREIAAVYNVSINELFRNNPALNGKLDLYEGQKLVISLENKCDREINVFGYTYSNISPYILRETVPYLTNIVPFTYGFNENGDLIMLNDELIRKISLSYGVNSIMHLSTLNKDGTFNSDLATDILLNKEARENLTENIIKNVMDKNYAGLDVDFEFLPGALSGEYANFISELREKLNQLGKFVYVALAPKTSSNQRGSLYEGHNYRLLSEAANAVLLMTYEWGYTYGPPMAVSPINEVKKVVEYAKTLMSPDKIFLGIPNYGYDFTLPFVKGKSKARLIGNEEALKIAVAQNAEILYDEEAQSPYFEYYNENVLHQVWFEDARSILEKLKLVDECDLKGVGYWNLMRPFTQNFQLLNNLFYIKQ